MLGMVGAILRNVVAALGISFLWDRTSRPSPGSQITIVVGDRSVRAALEAVFPSWVEAGGGRDSADLGGGMG
ncbi:MAG: hypothetical protein RLZZ511_2915 [Cyanobacteriota bacterium]|jgi:hypothetical protein